MKIAIAGSGALGSGFGGKFFKAGYDVTLIDGWGKQVETISENGLNIKIGDQSSNLNIPIVKDTELTEDEKFDYIFLFTKSMQLRDMLEKIAPTISEDTIIINTMNGLKHEDIMAEYIPKKQIIRGVTTFGADMPSPGHTEITAKGTVEVGRIIEEGEESLNEVVELLDKADFYPKKSDNIYNPIWKKVCLNATYNAICTILDCNVVTLNSLEHSQSLIRALVTEIVEVAKTDEVELTVDGVMNYLKEETKTAEEHYPSMHQDLIRNKRLTEIDFIDGAIAKIGKENNIPTPVSQFVTDLIHAKEELVVGKN